MTKLTDVVTNHMCITPNQTTTWKVSIQGGNAACKLQHKVHAHATQHNSRAMQGVLPVCPEDVILPTDSTTLKLRQLPR